MAPRLTHFNMKWKKIYNWINPVPDEPYKAYCTLCKRIFTISSKGEASIKEHQQGEKHQYLESGKGDIRHFFQKNQTVVQNENTNDDEMETSSERPNIDPLVPQIENANDRTVDNLAANDYNQQRIEHLKDISVNDFQNPSISSHKQSQSICHDNSTASTSSHSDSDECLEFDIGKWVGESSSMTKTQKLDILKKCWVPPKSYDFKNDVAERRIHTERKFLHEWLTTYAPWLVYSKQRKGAFCLYCVLFPPTVVQGVLGAFIVTPFTRYKDMHDACKNHTQSKWHKQSTASANSFMNCLPVDVVAISGHQILIIENRKILSAIISTIIFCGTHDLPLRGKDSHSGVFKDLIKFQIDSGHQVLKKHLDDGNKNATYLSVQIQNEIIELLGHIIPEILIEDVKKSEVYSILADETADISGKEQLSIGVRFFDKDKIIVREECLGFVELNAMDAKTIANLIDIFIQNHGLDPMKCVGQGYDGCSTMSGAIAGVQKILQEIYPKALS